MSAPPELAALAAADDESAFTDSFESAFATSEGIPAMAPALADELVTEADPFSEETLPGHLVAEVASDEGVSGFAFSDPGR